MPESTPGSTVADGGMFDWLSDRFFEFAMWLLKEVDDNPVAFFVGFFVLMSPFFLLSGYLSLKLSKELEQGAKDKERKSQNTQTAMIGGARRKKKTN